MPQSDILLTVLVPRELKLKLAEKALNLSKPLDRVTISAVVREILLRAMADQN